MRYPFIRTVTTLLLIVALTVQPLAAYASLRGCSTEGGPRQGCGCCEMDNAGKQCCGGAAGDAPKHDCCAGRPIERSSAESQAPSEASAEQRSLNAVADKTIRGAFQACSCDHESQPLGDRSSQRANGETRQTIAVGYSGFDPSSLADFTGRPSGRCHVLLPAPHHGLQVLLCIWRL